MKKKFYCFPIIKKEIKILRKIIKNVLTGHLAGRRNEGGDGDQEQHVSLHLVEVGRMQISERNRTRVETCWKNTTRKSNNLK